MNNLKRVILAPFAVVALAASVNAMANPVSHTIMLQATVPSSTFHVLPADSSWIGNTQVLPFNVVTGDLGSLTKSFDVKHTAGSITAQLTSSGVMVISGVWGG